MYMYDGLSQNSVWLQILIRHLKTKDIKEQYDGKHIIFSNDQLFFLDLTQNLK